MAEIYYSIYTDHDDGVGNQTIFTTTPWPHALACNVLLRKQGIMGDYPGPRGVVLDDQGRFYLAPSHIRFMGSQTRTWLYGLFLCEYKDNDQMR